MQVSRFAEKKNQMRIYLMLITAPIWIIIRNAPSHRYCAISSEMCLNHSTFLHNLFTNDWNCFSHEKHWFVCRDYVCCKSIIALNQKAGKTVMFKNNTKFENKICLLRVFDCVLLRINVTCWWEIWCTNENGFVIRRRLIMSTPFKFYTIWILLLFVHLITLSLSKHVNS